MDASRSVLLIDGYNVIAPVAPPGSLADSIWLHRERERLLQRLREHLPEKVRQLTFVIFDAANPPLYSENQYTAFGVNIRFAVGYPEADDLIEELIAACATPKRLAVVSSDHRLQVSAKRRSATVFDSEAWLEQLVSGRVGLAPGVFERLAGTYQDNFEQGKDTDSLLPSPNEVDAWLKEFDLE